MSSSALIPPDVEKKGGFDFSNYQRNLALAESGVAVLKAKKTGTTIVGCLFKNGVVLGADTRATSDTIVADKNCSKIHRLANRMYCCGAGTAADTEMTTKKIEAQLELLRLNLGRDVPVIAALRMIKQHLFRYEGHISAALVLGGVDSAGAHLYTIYPHGSTDRLPYATMGSGSLAAMAMFEDKWAEGMEEADAIKLVRNAIEAGITNDLGSGSNVDINIIRKNEPKAVIMRNYEIIGQRGQRRLDYTYPPGTTKVIKEKTEVIPLVVEKEEVIDRMDTD